MAFMPDDENADILTALLGESVGGLGGVEALQGFGTPYVPGEANDMALLSAVAQSPYYRGQVSQSGVGQISEAILPIALGLIAGQQAERKAKADSIGSALKLAITLNQLKAAGAKEQREVSKESRAEAKAKREEALFAQSQSALGTALGETDGKMQVGKIRLTPGGPTVEMVDPSIKTGYERAADSLARGLFNQGAGRPIVDKGEGGVVFAPGPAGMTAQPLPSRKAMVDAAKQYDDHVVFDRQADMYDAAIDAAGPEGVGIVGKISNALAATGTQLDALISETQQAFADARATANPEEYKKMMQSDTFKNLLGRTNPNVSRYQVFRAAIVFQAALAFGQGGRSMSDQDRQRFEEMLGGESINDPVDLKARLGALREFMTASKEMALRRSLAVVMPTGNVMTGSMLPPEMLPDPALSREQNEDRIADGLSMFGVTGPAKLRMTAEILKASGFSAETPD